MVHMTAEAKRDAEVLRYPHPGCFTKRDWNCLIINALTFLETPKRLQAPENNGFATEARRAQSGLGLKRGYTSVATGSMRNVLIIGGMEAPRET